MVADNEIGINTDTIAMHDAVLNKALSIANVDKYNGEWATNYHVVLLVTRVHTDQHTTIDSNKACIYSLD